MILLCESKCERERAFSLLKGTGEGSVSLFERCRDLFLFVSKRPLYLDLSGKEKDLASRCGNARGNARALTLGSKGGACACHPHCKRKGKRFV